MIPNKAIDTLRDRGLRLTRPRRIILDVVRSTDAHPTAAFVYRRVRGGMPRGGRGTLAARLGFEVLNHRTEYFGRWAACRRSGGRLSLTPQRRSHGKSQG